MAVDNLKYCFDKIECVLGETITITTVSDYENCPSGTATSVVEESYNNIYANGVVIGYMRSAYEETEFTPSAVGTYIITFEYGSSSVEITVTGGDSGVTWTIGNKEVASLTINNKEVKSILRTSDGETLYGEELTGKIMKFSQDVYTATEGSCSITCRLFDYDTFDVANKIMLIQGTDGSKYTDYTDENGECTFDLIGEGNITYNASFGNLSATQTGDILGTCLVNGMDNRLNVSVTCTTASRSTSGCASGKYKSRLKWDFNQDFRLAPLKVAMYCQRRTTSAGALNEYLLYTKTLSTNGFTDTISDSTCYSWVTNTKRSLEPSAVNSSQKILVTQGNWKYKPRTK